VCHCQDGRVRRQPIPHRRNARTSTSATGQREYGCFGECTNLPGTFQCRCPPGTHGDHTQRHGCATSSSPGTQPASCSWFSLESSLPGSITNSRQNG
jgi:hypothetical protein